MTDGSSILHLSEDLEVAHVVPAADGEAAVFTARSPLRAADEPNQDGALVHRIDAHRAILAVADGLGGHAGGAEAAQIALQALDSSLTTPESSADLRKTILDAIEAANVAVLERGVGSGTTLAIVEIDQGLARPYHVGDSDILITGQRGRVRLQTVAHSPVGYAREAGILSADEAMRHSERHIVSNMVGTPSMRIEIGAPVRLHARDTVVLCTDGLADNLYPEEIIEAVRCGPLARAAARLVEAGRKRMNAPEPGGVSKPDDLTFVLYRMQPRAAERRKGNDELP